MIPLRDTISSKNYPVVTNALIGINIFIFLLELAQGSELDGFIYLYGLVPARYSVPHVASYFTVGQQLFSLLSFMFLHGGFWHLLGNMWSLYIFGDNVEDSLGHWRFLAIYLLSGVAAGLAFALMAPASTVPLIGASGSVAGVLAAYMMLHPKQQVWILLFMRIPVPIPAFWAILGWVAFHIYSLFSQSDGEEVVVAWWAHLGGFVAGIVLLLILAPQYLRRDTTENQT